MQEASVNSIDEEQQQVVEENSSVVKQTVPVQEITTTATETVTETTITETTAVSAVTTTTTAATSGSASTSTTKIVTGTGSVTGGALETSASTPPEDISNNCDKDNESDGDDDENDDESKGENFDGYNGSGRTVTLQMLLAANVLQPGKSTMTIEYLGQRFVGDLLPDGKIKSQETETVFLSPSAWAMHCKRIINPDKKSGCGWASVKYKGKKLDAYKATWIRKCALQKESTPEEGYSSESEKKSETPPPPIKRTVLPHNAINNRNIAHDANTLIESVPFQSLNKMQPFLVTMNSSALFLADFHCHLTPFEVCGYLAGTWDVNSHTLSITKAFPCRNTRHDRQKAADVEQEIQKAIIKEQLIIVGWYHSHPKFQSQPTLRDCDTQLDYQIKMRGPSDVTYTPCVGFIFSPYYEENPSLESSITSFWVVPPPENRQNIEYGRPMLMQYAIVIEPEFPSDIETEMKTCVEYYDSFRNELIDFSNNFKDEITYLEKLKYSLYHKFPQKQNHKEFWNSVCKLLKCKEEDEFIAPAIQHPQLAHQQQLQQSANLSCGGFNSDPQSISSICVDIKAEQPEQIISTPDIKTEDLKDVVKIDDDDVIIKTGKSSPELKVLSLQEQLCLPSGLNMNPVRINSPLATASTGLSSTTSATPTTNTTTTTASSSPRDSPITIPSNSASPAKFEIPIRASPSPAKSDSSSNRTRNSPAPSPGKFSISDISRNSPSVTPNKYEPTIIPTPTATPNANDLMAASLAASLAGQLPPNFLTGDLSAFFQQQHQQQKDFGNSSLNQLAVAAAKAGNKPSSGSTSSAMDHYEKSNESMYSTSFNIPGTSKTIDANMLTKTSTPKQHQDSLSSRSARSSVGASYKTKLMKELEDLKNDPIKISELMRSPEYAALLLQQAEALGATTLGSLGFGTDFSFLSGNSTKKATTDYTNLLQASKLLGYDAYMQQAKSTNDLNSFFQQQMASTSSGSSSKKQQQQQQQQQQQSQLQQPDYATLLQTYSKLFDSSSVYPGVSKVGAGSGIPQELSSILSSAGNMHGAGGGSSNKKKDNSNDVLNQILQSDKNHELNALLYHQNKAAVDLNALFVPPPSSSTKMNNDNASNYYAQLAQEKMQDYAALFQQHHGKYGIPDPLSKSTLAANNMFMSPSTLLKLQQDSLNAIMMKPPKSSASSSSSSSSRARESSASPAQERLTPTKSNRESPATMSGIKYNFSAVDLAISSVSANTPSPSPSESSRRPSDTPPVDLSRMYQEPPPTKKRMEFSSIADLAAPPAKMNKPNDRDDVLNLSND